MASPLSVLSTKENLVGFDMVDGLMTAACVHTHPGNQLVLEKAAWKPYNPKLPPTAIASEIRQMWRNKKLGCFSVASCLRTRSLSFKRFQFSGIEPDELSGVLQLEAEDILQCDPEDVAFDWYLNPHSEHSKTLSGTLISVPRAEVDNHFTLLQKAALYPVACSISSFAIANIYNACHEVAPPSDNSTTGKSVVCLAHIGKKSADIVILYDNKSIYPRTVFVHASQAADPAKYFSDSINDLLSYYHFKLHLPEVSRICLTGIVDQDLLRKISDTVQLPVEEWNPLQKIHIDNHRLQHQIETADNATRAALSTAIGLALG